MAQKRKNWQENIYILMLVEWFINWCNENKFTCEYCSVTSIIRVFYNNLTKSKVVFKAKNHISY